MKQVKYYQTDTPVQLGDVVQIRIFFARRQGVVTYVPGISKKRSTLEYNGLTWVAIQEDRGSHLATVVDPDTGFLKKKVIFVRRGPQKDLPEEDPFAEPGEIEDDFGVSKEQQI